MITWNRILTNISRENRREVQLLPSVAILAVSRPWLILREPRQVWSYLVRASLQETGEFSPNVWYQQACPCQRIQSSLPEAHRWQEFSPNFGSEIFFFNLSPHIPVKILNSNQGSWHYLCPRSSKETSLYLHRKRHQKTIGTPCCEEEGCTLDSCVLLKRA